MIFTNEQKCVTSEKIESRNLTANEFSILMPYAKGCSGHSYNSSYLNPEKYDSRPTEIALFVNLHICSVNQRPSSSAEVFTTLALLL
jgi:hypothetical protein